MEGRRKKGFVGVGNDRKSDNSTYDMIKVRTMNILCMYENFVVFALADDEVICQVGLNTGEETAVRP